MKTYRSIVNKLTDAEFSMKFHAWLTLFFIALIPPSALWWSDSVPYLVALSVWAAIASHWAAFQGAQAQLSEESGLDNEDLDAKLDIILKQQRYIIARLQKVSDGNETIRQLLPPRG